MAPALRRTRRRERRGRCHRPRRHRRTASARLRGGQPGPPWPVRRPDRRPSRCRATPWPGSLKDRRIVTGAPSRTSESGSEVGELDRGDGHWPRRAGAPRASAFEVAADCGSPCARVKRSGAMSRGARSHRWRSPADRNRSVTGSPPRLIVSRVMVAFVAGADTDRTLGRPAPAAPSFREPDPRGSPGGPPVGCETAAGPSGSWGGPSVGAEGLGERDTGSPIDVWFARRAIWRRRSLMAVGVARRLTFGPWREPTGQERSRHRLRA